MNVDAVLDELSDLWSREPLELGLQNARAPVQQVTLTRHSVVSREWTYEVTSWELQHNKNLCIGAGCIMHAVCDCLRVASAQWRCCQ